ncbi:hypothetical protein [Olivibacter sp. XZL3]
MVFRGVLLGLMTSSLQQRILILGNPGFLIVAILFGFVHA